MCGLGPHILRNDRSMRLLYDFRAEALPPLRPAAFFCAVVPPWLELPPEPDFLPPRLDAPGELAILAARCLDIPLSFSASYCFSFLTFAFLVGICASSGFGDVLDELPRLLLVGLAPHVGLREHDDETAVLLDDWQPPDLVAGHQPQRL